jgi:hypothetical protein
MPKKFFKIGVSELIDGKKYYGLFISNNEEFACDYESFVRGWELSKFENLSNEAKEEWINELKKDSQEATEVK